MISLIVSKERVDSYLARYFDRKIEESVNIHPAYGRLYKELKRVSLAGGKRLRPHLAYIGAGEHNEQADAVATAHELLHIALLIHDDIIDRDLIRHNQPTIHGKYLDEHYNLAILDESERLHFSHSAALLGGDLLISGAYELLHEANVSLEKHRELQKLMTTSIFEVAGGELLDTEATFSGEELDPLLVYRYKTASYSTIAPLLSGAALRDDISQSDLSHLNEFAEAMGVAYQMQDDTLGVFGNSKQTGKSTLGDLREGKQTYLVAAFRSIADKESLQVFNDTFGNEQVSDEELKFIKELIRNSGALGIAQNKESEMMKKAIEAANRISISNLKTNLIDLVAFIDKRNA